MVGEIRDLETADIAIQAALTGHLVFSTLHTNDAPGAVTRLLDMGVEPYLVASVAGGGPRPAPRPADLHELPRAYQPELNELRALGIDRVPAGAKLSRGAGCDECRGTGYRGRTGIYEFMAMSEEIAEPRPPEDPRARDPPARDGGRHDDASARTAGTSAASASRPWMRSSG